MPVLKRDEIKMAKPSDSPSFEFDDDSLNPFLIQLALNSNSVPITLQEDNHPAGFNTSRMGHNGRTTKVRDIVKMSNSVIAQAIDAENNSLQN